MNEEKYNVIEYYRNCETIVSEIFRSVGFTTTVASLAYDQVHRHFVGDLMAVKDETKYLLEVKCSRQGRLPTAVAVDASSKLVEAINASASAIVPVLVVVGTVSNIARERLAKGFSQVIVIDIGNLLYMVESNEPLRNKLISLLPFSVDGVDPVRLDLEVSSMVLKEAIDKWDAYIRRIDGWVPSEEENAEYENLCCDILEDLFADDLTGWKRQQPSNNNLYRFDAIAKIKHGNKKEFWEMLERYFNSKYIIFEYKNYSKEITQAQVYTTVKYLYAKALRSVAILLSTEGADKHANIAIRGILREEGKLIITLSNRDLVTMLKMKQKDDDPADYLSEKLDALLIDLEK